MKHLLLSTLCALSLTAFAQEGTLIFYETFEDEATAESYPYEIDCKINGGFYLTAPAAFGEVNNDSGFGPDDCITCRWDYPNKSGIKIWAPHMDNNIEEDRQFEFYFTTKNVPYAYLSFATLWWGSCNIYYKFSGADEYMSLKPFGYTERGPKYPSSHEILGGWWFDRFAMNLGGQDEVYILIVQATGAPYMMDDLQISSYAEEIIYKGQLNNDINNITTFYDNNLENDEYCPNKLAKLADALDAARVVNESETATQNDVNAALLAIQAARAYVQTGRDDQNDDIYDEYDAAFKAFHAAKDAGEALGTVIEEGEYELNETLLDKFNFILDIAVALDDFCEIAYLNDLANELSSLTEGLQEAINAISVDNASETAFAILPNPADVEIRIAGAAGAVYIFNAAGQQVLSITNYQGDAIPVSSLAAGTYSVVNGKQSASFIKK